MERLTIEKCGELLIKNNDGEYRSPCLGCESISKCNPQKMVCGFYRALECLKEYEDIGLTPEQLIEIDKLYAEKCKELVEFQRNNLSGLELAQIWEKLEKLKEYQKLEEQGKLLKLPCAVGDTVYAIEADEDNFDHFHCPRKISEYKFNLQMLDLLELFGNCIFLTKEEAEAAFREITK